MDLTVLKDIVIIFALSTFVNLLFNKIKIPTVIGYLLTGVVAGPHLLKLVSTTHQIELMAEIGVVLLMFTIGMEFSLKHLLKIRKVVFLGGFLQVFITAGVFFSLPLLFHAPWRGSLFIGFLVALSSSALVLKLLQEKSELSSNYGRTILGILIFQDLLLVPLILFSNILGNISANIGYELIGLSFKAVLIIGFVYAGNKWIFPKLLRFIAMAKNQELFMMSIFLICLVVALLTSSMGMSLAFGAFLAGLMISESEYSHNAFGNIIPFKDTFTSFFFVSIGMLIDVSFVIENFQLVITSVALVVILKYIIAGGVGFALGHTFKGTVIIGLALSQVGEFSFILAKIGLDLLILSDFYYQLFLAVAVITMALTPFLIASAKPVSDFFLRFNLPKKVVEGIFPLKEMEIPELKKHIVIIGKDSSALKLIEMAKCTGIPYVSIIFDPVIVRDKLKIGDTVIYGDAVNEPILLKAHIDKAESVVISVGDTIPAMAIIEKVRKLNKKIFIIVRSKHLEDIEHFYKLGVDQVIPEKMEIAIDLFNMVLIKKSYSKKEINRKISAIRNKFLGTYRDKDFINKPSIIDELSNNEISALIIDSGSSIIGKNLGEIELRSKVGVTLMAVKRNDSVIEHPKVSFTFEANDVAYVIGNPEQIKEAYSLFSGV